MSTDDDTILRVSGDYGASTQVRPDHLCTDTASMFDVMRHHVDDYHDSIMVLQPTCPLRTEHDIDGAIEIFRNGKCSSVISFVRVGDTHPARMYVQNSNHYMLPLNGWDTHANRQQLPPVYLRSGDIYLVRTADLHLGRYVETLPWMIEPERWCNIDTVEDLELAEARMRRLNCSS